MSCIEADSKIIGLYEKLFAKNVKKKFKKKSHNTILIIDPTMKRIDHAMNINFFFYYSTKSNQNFNLN